MALAPILNAADEVVTLVNAELDITAERVYIHEDRMAKVTTTTQCWVQPVEHSVTTLTRAQNRNDYSIDVVLIRKCMTDDMIDEVLTTAYDLYNAIKRAEFSGSYKLQIAEMPTLFSPAYLNEKSLFACVISLTVVDAE